VTYSTSATARCDSALRGMPMSLSIAWRSGNASAPGAGPPAPWVAPWPRNDTSRLRWTAKKVPGKQAIP
jgi:hypothetical protein